MDDKRIAEKIVNLLVLAPNEYHDISYIWNNFYNYSDNIDENTYENINFKIICNQLANNYKNIMMFYKHHILFLALITDKTKINKEKIYNYKFDINIYGYEYNYCVSFVDAVIKNNLVSKINIYDYYHETNTLAHCVFRNGSSEIINKVINNWEIDIYIKNKNNVRIIDICKDRYQFIEIVEVLHNHNIKIIENLNKTVISHYLTSQQYLHTMNELKIQNDKNKKYMKIIKYYKYYINFLFSLCFVYFIIIMYLHNNKIFSSECIV
jgi:hypothetical protein